MNSFFAFFACLFLISVTSHGQGEFLEKYRHAGAVNGGAAVLVGQGTRQVTSAGANYTFLGAFELEFGVGKTKEYGGFRAFGTTLHLLKENVRPTGEEKFRPFGLSFGLAYVDDNSDNSTNISLSFYKTIKQINERSRMVIEVPVGQNRTYINHFFSGLSITYAYSFANAQLLAGPYYSYLKIDRGGDDIHGIGFQVGFQFIGKKHVPKGKQG